MCLMRSFQVFFLALLLIAACSTNAVAQNAEPRPTGIPLVRLDDVQGLFGGQTLVIDATGGVFVRKVSQQKEVSYHLKLTPEELKTLLEFIPTSGIYDYVENRRYGVPDEARPRLTLILPNRKQSTAEKWANTKDDHFDKLYQRLLGLVEQAAKTKPYRKRDTVSEKFP